MTINFDSTESYDPDNPYGSIIGYSWDFGDGGSSTNANPSHSYSTGWYDLTRTLTVTDDLGDTGTDTVVNNCFFTTGCGLSMLPVKIMLQAQYLVPTLILSLDDGRN